MINIKEKYLKSNLIITIAFLLVMIFFVVSVCVGKYTLSIDDIISIIKGRHSNQMSINVFYMLRLPRSIMVVIAGIGLSVAGSVYQTIFKNPLASPDIIGVTSGSNVGAALSIVLLSGNVLSVVFSSFVGGILALFLVVGLVKLSSNDNILTYVLSGIVINSISNGIIMVLKYFSDPENQLGAIEYWTMGSFGGINTEKVKIILPFFLLGMAGIFLMRWKINILSISDAEGKTLGVSVEKSRYIILFFSTLVVASIVSVTGLISFIGLIPPHIARSILKKNDFNTMILSGLAGAVLITLSDCLIRAILPTELPISIVTSFIGAPYLAFLVCNKKKFSGE